MMGSSRKIDRNLSFRNFSPFYEKALAESKRGENILKIIEKDIDKRKMVAYSQLTAEQRIVEKDLHALKMAQRRIWEDKKKRGRRAVSESGIDDIGRSKPPRRFTSMEELIEFDSCPCARKSPVKLPPLQRSKVTVKSSVVVRTKIANIDALKAGRSSQSITARYHKDLVGRSVSAPAFLKTSEIPFIAGISTSFAQSKNVFDGQF